MLTTLWKEENGTLSAIRFVAENMEEREHLAAMQEAFLKMASSEKPEEQKEQ